MNTIRRTFSHRELKAFIAELQAMLSGTVDCVQLTVDDDDREPTIALALDDLCCDPQRLADLQAKRDALASTQAGREACEALGIPERIWPVPHGWSEID